MNVRINNKQPNKAQMKVLREECVKEFNKLLAAYNREAALQILYILRFHYGFGQKRLEQFGDRLKQMQLNQEAKYELKESDTAWICERQLIESGIDVARILD